MEGEILSIETIKKLSSLEKESKKFKKMVIAWKNLKQDLCACIKSNDLAAQPTLLSCLLLNKMKELEGDIFESNDNKRS